MTLASPRRVLLGALACAAVTFARTAAADPPPASPPPVPQPQSAAPMPQPQPVAPVTVAPGHVAPPSGAPGYSADAPPLPPGYAAPGGYAQPGYGPPGYGPPGYNYPGQYPGMAPQPPLAHNAYTLPELPPRRRYDTGLFVGGVVAVGGGMALALVGAYLVSSAAGAIPIFCDTPSFPCAYKTDASRLSGGAVLMAAGAAVGVAGIPMWLIGSQYVTVPKGEKRAAAPDPRPEVRVGAGSASATWRF